MASSVSKPLLNTLASPFPPQKTLLYFAWGELARKSLVMPLPIAPGSVSVLAPLCARMDNGWWQPNGSVTADLQMVFFHRSGKIPSRMENEVKDAGKTNK